VIAPLAQTEGLKGVDLFQGLANLGLEENDEKEHKDLPEDLKNPGGQEEAPSSGEGEDKPQCEQSHQGLESLGPPEPEVKVVGNQGQEKDVQDILKSQVNNNVKKMHCFSFSSPSWEGVSMAAILPLSRPDGEIENLESAWSQVRGSPGLHHFVILQADTQIALP
jgi:hypothetical protein